MNQVPISETRRTRKQLPDTEEHGPPPKKARRKATPKTAEIATATDWPEHFHSLFALFKAINTVLAFIASRQTISPSFPVIRASVENIIKKPLDIEHVAQIKVLLPSMMTFAYIPRNELPVNDEPVHDRAREGSPVSFAGPSMSRDSRLGLDEGHVLVLNLHDTWTGQSAKGKPSPLTLPSRTPAATKKMIDSRNKFFANRVDELLQACWIKGEDPVELVESSAVDHIPLNPDVKNPRKGKEVNLPIPSPENRPSVDAVLAEIEEQEWYMGEIAIRKTFQAKPAQHAELDSPLSESIVLALLRARKINSFYAHQVAAIQALWRGKDVIVSTSTASGKSVIYQVPLLRMLEENRDTKAIFVYPTKALAQDQKGALEQLLCACPGLERVKVATYDGDTPKEMRRIVRETASVIFTNFDTIHASILPHEEQWRTFLKNLKLFVVDELHYYSGMFGSHVAYVMRRFRRVCSAVGNRRAQFVSCSATISKPLKHMQDILGLDPNRIEVVTQDGAPTGSKDFVLWSTRSEESTPMKEAVKLMIYLMKRGLRVILFCKIRNACELAMKMLRTDLSTAGNYDMLKRVRAYRGGYSPEDRREIEQEAFTGHLLGLVATNALELGVDIGSLDAVLMLGFPHSLASFRQQAGRAGRRSRDSLAMLILESAPLDSYYFTNPDELYDQDTDDLVVDLESKIILEAHLQCAALEMPISLSDETYFGPNMVAVCDAKLTIDHEGWYHTNAKFLPYPSQHVSIRGSEEDNYILVDITKGNYRILEQIEYTRALFSVYEGAVYLHQGSPFIVKEIVHDTKLAKLVQVDVNWITKPRDFTDVNAIQVQRIREIKGSPHRAYYGRIEVRAHIFGFYKMRHNVILDSVDLETDPYERQTTGLWIDVPKHIVELLRQHLLKPAAAIHAASHAFLNRFPLSEDLRTECKAVEKEYLKSSESKRKRPARLIVYDTIGTVGGVSPKAFDHVYDILKKAHDRVESCPCADIKGCMHCVQSPKCKERNKVTSKVGGLVVLKGVLGLEFDPDSIPWPGWDEDDKSNYDSIVDAPPLPTFHIDVEVAP